MEAVKKAVVKAMIETFGNITESCKLSKISRPTFYKWKDEDQEFKDAVEGPQYEEMLLDMIDDGLNKLAKKKNVPVLIFMAKTKGKKRGYIERVENALFTPKGINISYNLQPGNEPLNDD